VRIPLKWEAADIVTGGIPHFFQRCALTRDLFDLVVELRPTSSSAALAENIRRECQKKMTDPGIMALTELHLLEHHKRHLEYLQYFELRPHTPFAPLKLKLFASESLAHPKSISADTITELFTEFSNQTRKVESENYLRTLTGLSPHCKRIVLTHEITERCLHFT
jgi:hypothetical protein